MINAVSVGFACDRTPTEFTCPACTQHVVLVSSTTLFPPTLHCRYTSQVYLHRPDKVISKVSDSTLFDHLDTTWKFDKGPTPDSCWLSFQTDFRFRSPLYAQVANVFFDEVRPAKCCFAWACECAHEVQDS